MGFQDEVWWSRVSQPTLSSWTADRPLRLIEQPVAKTDPDPKALACYGLLVRQPAPEDDLIWLRFVDGRPVSAVTIPYLAWCCSQAAQLGKQALVLIWDNASWHTSRPVRGWIQAHNRQVKQTGSSVRLLVCYLPIKSPWLNPIEPKWAHGKRRVAEPARLLTAAELEQRVCEAFGCACESHLAIPEQAA